MKTIFEGLNCVGKTSLAQFMEGQLPPKRFTRFYSRRDVSLSLDELMEGINQDMNSIDELSKKFYNVIVDRFHFTEYAYSLVYNRRNIADANKIFKDTERKLIEAGYAICYLTLPVNYIKGIIHQERPEMSMVDVDSLDYYMDRAFDMSELPKIKIDANQTLELMHYQVIEFNRKARYKINHRRKRDEKHTATTNQ